MDFDLNGWAAGPVRPLPPDEAWSLLSPEPGARIEAERWAHQAETFFRARLSVVQAKIYPAGGMPIADAVEVEIGRNNQGSPTRVFAVTLPLDRAPDVRMQALLGVQAIGGAGFDVLVARARRVWQVRDHVEPGGDPAAPLALAAVLALVLLAPIVPPGESTIFGVKGARQRLEARGWKT